MCEACQCVRHVNVRHVNVRHVNVRHVNVTRIQSADRRHELKCNSRGNLRIKLQFDRRFEEQFPIQ